MQDNKEYILNIRVSKDTYDKLKRKARENKETLSGLVRKTIDDSYELLGDLKKDLFGEENKGRDGLVYYQKVTAARDIECDRCHRIVPKGSAIFMGETKSGAKKYFCTECFGV